MSHVPTRLRSVLFAPASRPDVLRKLPRSGPDAVVLDLEDAVPADGKPEARVHARDVGAELADEHPTLAVFVRVNAVSSPWFADDVRDGLAPGLAGVVVPKVETPADVEAAAQALDRADLGGLTVFAGVETALGVARVDELLSPPVAAVYFGAEDFIADMGGVRTEAGTEVLYARSRVALAARVAGVHAVDQIVAAFDDDERFLRRRSTGTGDRVRREAVHPPGAGPPGQRGLLAVRGRRRPGPPAPGRVRRGAARAGTRRSRSRVRWSTSPWRAGRGAIVSAAEEDER